MGHKQNRERDEMAAVVGGVVFVGGGGVVVNGDNQRQEGRQEPEAPQLQCVPCWLMFTRILPHRCAICVLAPDSALKDELNHRSQRAQITCVS